MKKLGKLGRSSSNAGLEEGVLRRSIAHYGRREFEMKGAIEQWQ